VDNPHDRAEPVKTRLAKAGQDAVAVLLIDLAKWIQEAEDKGALARIGDKSWSDRGTNHVET
jgi:hypothetical protein